MDTTTPPDIHWYRTPVEPAVLDELNQRHDGLGLIQALGHLGLFVATGTACWFAFETQSWWLLALALLAHGTVASFMAAANHELLHGTVFSTPALNALFLHLFSVLVWENPYRYRASHMEHHKYTLHFPADSDEVLPRSVRVREFLNYAVIDWRNLYTRVRRNLRFSFGLIEDAWDLHLFKDPDRQRTLFNWSRMVVVFHVATTALAFYFHLWFLPVIVSGAPAFGRALFFIVNNTQHLGLMEGTGDFRLAARTIRMNPLLRFIYWQMNYHIEHHMYPAVPCYKLARLHEAIKHDLPPQMNGLIATWQQIIAVQYRQEHEDSTYRFRQAIPGELEDSVVAPTAPTTTVAPEAALARRVPQRGKSSHRTVMSTAELQAAGLAADLKVLECAICGFIYDEALGLPEEGLAPGTRWSDIPEDWRCPHCGIRKSRFKMIERIQET